MFNGIRDNSLTLIITLCSLSLFVARLAVHGNGERQRAFFSRVLPETSRVYASPSCQSSFQVLQTLRCDLCASSLELLPNFWEPMNPILRTSQRRSFIFSWSQRFGFHRPLARSCQPTASTSWTRSPGPSRHLGSGESCSSAALALHAATCKRRRRPGRSLCTSLAWAVSTTPGTWRPGMRRAGFISMVAWTGR